MANTVAKHGEPDGSITQPAKPLNALLLGGCMLHWPILRTRVHHAILECDTYGRLIEVFTFAEMLQLLAVLQEKVEIPATLRPLARMPADFRARVPVNNFEAMDVALVCPSSPIELTFRGIAVNGQCLLHLVLDAIQGDRALGLRLAQQWLRSGLQQLNHSVRVDAGAKLLRLIDEPSPAADLARAVIEEARSHPADIGADLRRLRDLVGRPMGVILYYFRYMPNGRALSWPAGFHQDLLASAKALGIPVYDPAPLVIQHGVTSVLNGNRHYNRKFLPLAGAAIAEFAVSIVENRAAPGTEQTPFAKAAPGRFRVRDVANRPYSEIR